MGSRLVPGAAGLVAAIAAAYLTAGCAAMDDTETARYCVDRTDQRVPEAQCRPGPVAAGHAPPGQWYYQRLPQRTYGYDSDDQPSYDDTPDFIAPGYGQRVIGGSRLAPGGGRVLDVPPSLPGRTSVVPRMGSGSSSTTSRGGFGVRGSGGGS
jgi:hypothetical protein